MNRLAVAATIMILARTALGQSAPAPRDAASRIEQGGALYAHLCSQCHGMDMISPGTVAPDLREFPHDAKTRFVATVTHGKNNRMPPWGDKLSPAEIDELWAYISSDGK